MKIESLARRIRAIVFVGLALAAAPATGLNRAPASDDGEPGAGVRLLVADVSLTQGDVCRSVADTTDVIGRICVVDIQNRVYLIGRETGTFTRAILNFPLGLRPGNKVRMHILYSDALGYPAIIDSGQNSICLTKQVVAKYGIERELRALSRSRAIRWDCPINPLD